MKKIVISEETPFILSYNSFENYLRRRGIQFYIKKAFEVDNNLFPMELWDSIGNKDDYYVSYYDNNDNNKLEPYKIQRDDPDLIYLVENNLACNKYNYGKLKIVSIPDDVEWEIGEYESGGEFVAEKHRIWN